jgi:hypothetical protein
MKYQIASPSREVITERIVEKGMEQIVLPTPEGIEL